MSTITIRGLLAADAEHRCRADGSNELQLQVQVSGGDDGQAGPVLRVIKPYGSGNAAGYAAKSRAHHLRRGVAVIVDGAGLKLARGRLELLRVSHVAAPDLDQRAVLGSAD